MRVLFIHHTAAVGGSLQSLLVTVRGLVQAGSTVIVATPADSPKIRAAIEATGAEFVVVPSLITYHHTVGSREALWTARGFRHAAGELSGWIPKSLRVDVKNLVDRTRPDIIHLNSLVLAPVAAVLQEHSEPYVWHVREPLYEGRFGLRARYFRKLAMKAGPRMIFISEWDRQLLGLGQQGLLLENFVDLEYWNVTGSESSARRDAGVSADDFVILYVGGPSIIKGPDVLVEALALIRERNPRVKLIAPGLKVADAPGALRGVARAIARRTGHPPFRDVVWARIDALDLTDIVIAPPPVTDVRSMYALADVVVFPSVVPHFARPAIEAMAAGKAFVGSDLPGVSSLVDDGESGLLVSPRDPAALADALMKLGNNEKYRFSLSRRGYERARHRFSAEEQIPKLIDHYRTVLQLDQHGRN